MALVPLKPLVSRGSCSRTSVVAKLACASLGLLFPTLVGHADPALDSAKIVGPNACAECHKQETEAWKATHHFATFRELPRSNEARDIAQRMGVRRVKSESLCLNCHFTVQQKDGPSEPISGISCESCHDGGKDWIKIHSGYSGKTAKTETKAEAAARWKLADSKGMIRPRAIYQIAKRCYGCHVVPQEDLVNKGRHRPGSAFELVSWSQGEVRHSTWYSRGKENSAASAARRRMLFIVGVGVELETALRGVAKATARKPYALFMAERADQARKQVELIVKAVPNVPELQKLLEYSRAAALKLDNERALTSAADGVSQVVASMTEKYDGSTMPVVDKLIPGPEKYIGAVRQPTAAN
jgi:hypothetical protein